MSITKKSQISKTNEQTLDSYLLSLLKLNKNEVKIPETQHD